VVKNLPRSERVALWVLQRATDPSDPDLEVALSLHLAVDFTGEYCFPLNIKTYGWLRGTGFPSCPAR